jgi:hypothetical protein
VCGQRSIRLDLINVDQATPAFNELVRNPDALEFPSNLKLPVSVNASRYTHSSVSYRGSASCGISDLR